VFCLLAHSKKKVQNRERKDGRKEKQQKQKNKAAFPGVSALPLFLLCPDY
jgi:hypothetical protein